MSERGVTAALVVAFLAFSAADAATLKMVLDAGQAEGNPLPAFLISVGGFGLALLGKALVTAYFLFAARVQSTLGWRYLVLAIGVGASAVGVATNLIAVSL